MKNKHSKKFNKKFSKKITKKPKKSDVKDLKAIYRTASKNFGFAKLLNGTSEEIFIPARDSMNAMDEDKVLIEITKHAEKGKSREGKVVKILGRERDTIIGYFEPSKSFGFVRPLSKKIPFDIHIEKKFFGKAVKDSLVEVKLLTSKSGGSPEGVVVNVIGHKDDANAEITAIVRDYRIKDIFDEETIKEADDVATPLSSSDMHGRHDLRDKMFITIDGEDTKDIDDAIYLEKTTDGYKLFVSIADVSHYVKEGSSLDNEALQRGNSVYLLDRVIPMLPHVLSNGMCSLNEGEDRLSMTCEITFDNNGRELNHDIYTSVINSHKRMTYTETQAIIDNAESAIKDAEKTKIITASVDIQKMIFDMIELSRKLRKIKEKRGFIVFDIKESYIVVDEELKPTDVKEREVLEAHKLIEDFMVAANEAVATEFHSREVPFLYRVHEAPDDEKLSNFYDNLASLAVPYKYMKEVTPKDIQEFLKSCKGKDYEDIVAKITLRSMMQAKYSSEALGHFALASKYYSHFTSPIRRYSDLQIHRIIHEILENRFDEKRKDHYKKLLNSVAFQVSKAERTAIDCERDIEDLKKCEYMKDHIGEEFTGTVSGITSFGIFVELPNTIEGMIPIHETKNHEFKFGEKVDIIVAKCLPEIRAIDFSLSR